jgi:hypothetical protein
MTYQLRQPIQQFNWSIKQELDTKPNWNVTYAYKGYGYAIKRDDGSLVCNLPDGLRQAEKELAQFLAVSPEMYDALGDALDLITDYQMIDEKFASFKGTKKVIQTITKLLNKIECE